MEENNMKSVYGFPDRLYRLMKDKNLNAIELGKLCGKERKTIYSYVHGEAMPNCFTLAKICVRLGVSADYLLFGKLEVLE